MQQRSKITPPDKRRKRRSAIWRTSDADFSKLVSESLGVGQVLNAFGLENVGRNHHTAQARIMELGLSTTHFDPTKRAKSPRFIKSIDEMLVEDSTYSRGSLKARLISTGLIPYLCGECGMGPVWEGKPLVLRLDHINGRRRDCRKENLRFLCPNCDAQQPTFCGKNRKTN